MRLRVLLPILLLLCAAPVFAQKKPRKPKPTNFVVLLPIVSKVAADPADQEVDNLLARLSIIDAFKERGLNVLSPAQTQVQVEVMKVDFNDPGTWTLENLRTLATNVRAVYVTGVTLKSAAVNMQPDSKGNASVAVELSAILYGAKDDKLLRENEVFAETELVKVDPKKPLSERSVRLAAVSMALKSCYLKGFLEKMKKVPSPEKPKKQQ